MRSVVPAQGITKTTIDWLRRHARLLTLVTVLLAGIPQYVHAYTISQRGVSEVPTILAGDTILVNHAAYAVRLPYSKVQVFRTGVPQRGDMVLVALPTGGVAPKRVMAIPGDTIEVRDNRLIVNGASVPVIRLNRSAFEWVPAADRLGSVVVNELGHWVTYTPGRGAHRNHPPTHIENEEFFLLGDNRDESADSRTWGPLSANRILGKVLAVLATGPRESATRSR